MFEHLQILGAILAKQMMSQPHGAYLLAAGNQCSNGKKKASDLECCFQQGGEERPLKDMKFEQMPK